MIPKVIHYCWFGRGPMPEVAQECIDSWRKFMPDYEIKLWNEDNFDVNICTYTAEAYRAKKYAFVSDYARLWILYNYGGVYFDTDVKLLASPEHILANGPFMGLEVNGFENKHIQARCNPGLGMAGAAGMLTLRTLLDRYDSYRFISPSDGSLNLKTIVEYTTELLHEHGFPLKTNEIVSCAGFNIYPKDYFSPRSVDGRETIITPNTVSIHLFTNTWGELSPFKKAIEWFNDMVIFNILPNFIIKSVLNFKKKKRHLKFITEFTINHPES